MIAAVLGGSREVWEDLAGALSLIGDREHIIVATNFAGFAYAGHIDAWATLHPEHFDHWKAKREMAGFNTDYRSFIHSGKRHRNGEVVPQGWYASSGLYGAQVALEVLDAKGVILCGVPMDTDAGHFAEPGDWPAVDRYRPGFLQAKADGANFRSMSGWSAGVFGEPDEDWIRALNLGPKRPRPRKETIMREVTFKKLYRHRLPNGHADYPAGSTHTVSEAVAAQAEKAGALKAEKKTG